MQGKRRTLRSLLRETETNLSVSRELCEKLIRSVRRVARVIDEDSFESDEDEWFWRRTLIQYLFASIEAEVAKIKLESLQRYEDGDCVLGRGEVHYLRGKDFKVNDKGVLEEKGIKSSTKTDTLFAMRIFSKAFSVKCFPDTKGDGFQKFLQLIKIRNSIIHPKKPDDLVITPEMTEICIQAWEWFGRYVSETNEAVIEKLENERVRLESSASNN